MENQTIKLLPNDEYNQKLISFVHPENWVNPTPKKKYDLVVIGAGTGGLVVAAGVAGLGLGLKIALIEQHLMGGDCLNFGCVPSKAIIRSSKILGEIFKGQNLGINVKEVEINFKFAMERMRKLRAEISHHDSAERFKNLGIDVFLGKASFFDKKTIMVGEKKLSFNKAVIATGATAIEPNIKGIKDVNFYTNATIFSLTELPKKLAIIGGGAIGCELAQAFQRLGSKVTLFHKRSQILDKEDLEAGEIIQKTFIKEGINLILNSELLSIENTEQGKKIYYKSHEQKNSIIADEILIAVGKIPNIDELNLLSAGVEFDRTGIKINDYLQTTNPSIYAVGDVCLPYKFTHTADASARIVIKNALFSPFGLGKSKFSDLVIPHVIYTNPEVAHVGKYEHELKALNIPYNIIKIPLSNVDRAILDEETEGFIKVYHHQNNDRILGATIVANHAGDMISEITSAMVNNIGLNGLSGVIHPYPTQAEAIKKVADSYRRSLLTPTTRKILGFLKKLS